MNRVSVLVVLVVVALVTCLQVTAHAQSGESEWMRLIRQQSLSDLTLGRLRDQIRLALKKDSTAAAHCIEVISDHDTPAPNRRLLVTVLVESDDIATLHALVGTAVADLDVMVHGGEGSQEARWRVESVLRGLGTNPHLAILNEDGNLLRLLEWASEHGYDLGGRGRYELILKAPVDDRIKSRLFCNAILTPDGGGTVDCRMPLEVLEESDRARLRGLLENWTGELRTYPSKATWPLLLLGDERALEVIRRWRDADWVDQRIRESVGDLVALGEGRRDPKAALRYLESGGLLASSEAAACVLQSAIDLGVDRDAVRNALFARERKVNAAAANLAKTERSIKSVRSGWLWPIKQAAMSAGVFDGEDWPDVVADSREIAGIATP